MASSSRETFRNGAIVCRHLQQLVLVVVVWLAFVPSTQTNPGFQFRLSRSGLNYGATVAVDILSRWVQQAEIPDIHDATYDITNMQVVDLDRPTVDCIYQYCHMTFNSAVTWFVIYHSAIVV